MGELTKILTVVASLFFATTALAQTGRWDGAERYYDPAEMEAAKRALQEGSGGTTLLFLEAERLEYRSNEGAPVALWDAQGWYGGDAHKIWVKTEGEYAFAPDRFEEAELQVLYSRPVSAFFDLQAGLRHDFEPHPATTYGVLGFQGLAPYWFEVDAALFISENGDLSARIEAEYELLVTQRLIFQPRVELDFALQDVEELGIGSGLSTAELGVRLRYEIDRQFAPYVGVSWERKVGETADFARAEGEDTGSLSFVAGLRLWF